MDPAVMKIMRKAKNTWNKHFRRLFLFVTFAGTGTGDLLLKYPAQCPLGMVGRGCVGRGWTKNGQSVGRGYVGRVGGRGWTECGQIMGKWWAEGRWVEGGQRMVLSEM
jgi:hypothetical protein